MTVALVIFGLLLILREYTHDRQIRQLRSQATGAAVRHESALASLAEDHAVALKALAEAGIEALLKTEQRAREERHALLERIQRPEKYVPEPFEPVPAPLLTPLERELRQIEGIDPMDPDGA